MRDGLVEEILESDGLTVSVSLLKVDWDYLNKNYAVKVHVKNASEKRVEIDPSVVTLIEATKEKPVDRVAVERLINMHGKASSASWAAFVGKNQTADALQAQSTANFLLTTALKANTVLPGQEVGGNVWFKQSGNSLFVQVSMGGKVFEFPFRF